MHITTSFMATLVAGLLPSSLGQVGVITTGIQYTPEPTPPPISYATLPPTTASPVGYTPPPTPVNGGSATNGTVTGDPHFKTWAGVKYDYHGICDLVLLQNPNFANGLGMHIHIRAKPQGLVGSYIETAVVRIGDNTLEVMGGEDANRYWIDGVEGAPLDESTSLSGYPIQFDMPSPRQREFTIGIGDSGRIKIKSFKHLLNVNVGPGNESHEFRGSLGLMGAFDTGLRVARDGQRVLGIPAMFGSEWQVRDTDPKLFHSLDGPQYPDPCTFPWDGTKDLNEQSNLRRRLSESKISEADAERACEMVPEVDRDDCIFDVLAMDDIDFAGAY